jgi:energy-coupling factor transporter ATP-binding protein EcfA2
MSVSIGGIPVRNTRDLINENTKLCTLIHAPSGFGKTTLAATLDRMCKRFFGKPALFIAIEAGEGGGTMSVQDAGVDYIKPASMDEFNKVVAGLAGDTHYAGVICDSASEYVNRYLKPYALKFPYTKGTAAPTRAAGVPEQGDYQTMGEQARIDFNKLINLTEHPDLKVRKHLVVTALQKDKIDRKTQEVTAIQPDLPGAMAAAATAMFQTVASIAIKTLVQDDPAKAGQKIRVKSRVMVTDADGVLMVKDRTNVFPKEAVPDFECAWEHYWLPAIEKRKQIAA